MKGAQGLAKRDWTQNQASFQVPLRKDHGKESCEETGAEQGSTAGNSSQPTASAALDAQGFKFSKKRRYA